MYQFIINNIYSLHYSAKIQYYFQTEKTKIKSYSPSFNNAVKACIFRTAIFGKSIVARTSK